MEESDAAVEAFLRETPGCCAIRTCIIAIFGLGIIICFFGSYIACSDSPIHKCILHLLLSLFFRVGMGLVSRICFPTIEGLLSSVAGVRLT